MVSEGALSYSNSPCHCPTSHSAILDEPSAIVWHKRPLLGSMNWSLNRSSTPTAVIIDQWLRLSASEVPSEQANSLLNEISQAASRNARALLHSPGVGVRGGWGEAVPNLEEELASCLPPSLQTEVA